jgi:glycosyltransferase involved in cell wall biosynthesis
MKILIYKSKQVIDSYGGIEKCMCTFANMLADNGHDVTYLTSENKKGLPAYPLNSNVEFKNIGKIKVPVHIKLISKLFKNSPLGLLNYKVKSTKLKKIVNQYDLVITTGINESIDILFKQNYSIPHICMIHSKPEIHLKEGTLRTEIFKKHILSKITITQVLLDSYKAKIENNFNFNKIVSIGNSVDTNVTDHKVQKNNTIICVSTIVSNKNQMLLLKAFNLLKDKYKDWNIELWGQTSNEKYEEQLKNFIQQNDLTNRVIFKGTTDAVDLELQKAQIFAFPTKYEGFSLALTEAMACKLPVVGLKTASCVNELVLDNKTGFLVDENPQDFANALDKLMQDEALRAQFGQTALKSLDKYSVESINRQWLDLIDSLKAK